MRIGKTREEATQAIIQLKNRPLLLCTMLTVLALVLSLLVLSMYGVIAGLLALAIVLVLFEVLLRFVFRFYLGSNYSRAIFNYSIIDDSRYGYSLRPNFNLAEIDEPVYDRFLYRAGAKATYCLATDKAQQVRFTVNSMGYRGAEFSNHPSSGPVRILCSGGSTTAGSSVHDNETWPAFLQKGLNEKGIEAEVINGGVFGWYSTQELARLKHDIEIVRPDVILLHQGWNEEFEFSSQNLGRGWNPRALRSNTQANYLYTSAPVPASICRSLFGFFSAQAIFKQLMFEQRCSFTNPERWQALISPDYVEAWLENLKMFAELARLHGASLFTLNYPCLARYTDTASDRKDYYEHTRLTPLFADYQALSKARISHVLMEFSGLVPCLNAEVPFNQFQGERRRALFVDELHLTAPGNEMLGNCIAELLSGHPGFRHERLVTPAAVTPWSEAEYAAVKGRAVRVPSWMERAVRGQQYRLKIASGGKDFELPSERYTTF